MLMFCDPADLERGFGMGKSKERHSSRAKDLWICAVPAAQGHTSLSGGKGMWL